MLSVIAFVAGTWCGATVVIAATSPHEPHVRRSGLCWLAGGWLLAVSPAFAWAQPAVPNPPPTAERTSETPEAGIKVQAEGEKHDGIAAGVRGVANEDPLAVSGIVRYPDRGEASPQWLEAAPWNEGRVRFVPVVSKVQLTARQADDALDKELRGGIQQYVNEFLDSANAATLLKFTSEELDPRSIVRETFSERVTFSRGDAWQAHGLLVFDKDFQDRIAEQWRQVKAGSRLLQAGLGAGVVLLLLTTVFGFFKVDTATRGYYTRRLQLLAVMAILMVFVAAIFAARTIPWL